MNPIRVLFVCSHNASRSQMAEAFLRLLGGDAFEVESAGTEPRVVHPLTIEVMAEAGIDISGHRAKTVDDFVQQRFDYVITLCDEANEVCPFFPNATHRLHWSLPDPSLATGSREKRLAVFRSVRDAVKSRLEDFLAHLPDKPDDGEKL